MRILLLLALAALLEVGGDACVRAGMRHGNALGYAGGAVVLFAYGVTVNLPRWYFGRLLGVYIAMFFVVSQAISVIAFRERPDIGRLIGGALVIAGGIVMSLWHAPPLPAPTR